MGISVRVSVDVGRYGCGGVYECGCEYLKEVGYKNNGLL